MINKTHRKFFKPDYNNNGVLAGFRNNIKLDRMKVNSETKSAIHLLQKFEKCLYNLINSRKTILC
jgi:hypothetical protein